MTFSRSTRSLTISLVPTRRRRAGSILIFVVALLTLVALIGTALIATARIDRYATRAYVASAESDATRSRFLEQVRTQVEDALANDRTPDVDGLRTDPWLAARLPEQHPGAGHAGEPVWHYITGRVLPTSTIDNVNAAPNDQDYAPPFQTNPLAPTNTSALIKFTTTPANYRLAAPTSISITYPNTVNYPVESLRGKTRTFPALTFYDETGGTLAGTNTFLAGDADGDGIADAVLYRLTPTPIDGVTYYAAVRIIDNNSAINVNTAWSRDNDDPTAVPTDPPTPPAADVKTFFPSNIGLQEMLSRYDDPLTTRKDYINEMAELNEYRLGYDTVGTSLPNDAGGWCDAFKDYSTAATPRSAPDLQAMIAGTTPVEDPEAKTSPPTPVEFGNTGLPTSRNDFSFLNRSEAFHMQLARRTGNPGFNTDPAYTPATSPYFTPTAAGTPFNYRSFSVSDGVNLAYRFCMVNPEVQASELELRLRRSAYESAPNYTDNIAAGYIPGTGYSNSSASVAKWKSFPANDYRLWFQFLNYDPNPAGGVSMSDNSITLFTPNANVGSPANTANTSAGTGQQQFRSIRPLLTTYNPTANLIPTSGLHSNLLYSWNRSTPDPNMLYPGMLSEDMSTHKATAWTASPAQAYRMFDMVYDDQTRLTYMRVSETTNNPQPWIQTTPAGPATNYEYTYWEPQPRVTSRAKANANLAGFPELWRAFYNVMTEGTPTLEGGTPFDETYRTEVGASAGGSAFADVHAAFFPPMSPATAGYYDIYRGMHWTEAYGSPFDFDPTATLTDPRFDPSPWSAADAPSHPAATYGAYEQNSLRMFRSPIRDPRPIASAPNPGLHRLTPHQVMALRSAIAANNAKQMLSHGTDVVTRKITLYDVDANVPNPPVGGTPSAANPVPQYEVTLYGNAPQPFITEVFASNDTFGYQHHVDQADPASAVDATYQNPAGYVAIELYNPYDVPIQLNGFKLAKLPREATAGYTNAGMNLATAGVELTEILTTVQIPPNGYVVLESHGEDAGPGGLYRPKSLGAIVGVPVVVPQLAQYIGLSGGTSGELVLLRPRVLNTTANAIEDMVPVDHFDFTGFGDDNAAPGAAFITWHYARNTADADWQWVYPGRYDASSTLPVGSPRQQGVQRTPANNHVYTPDNTAGAGQFDPWIDPATVVGLDDGQQWADMIQFGGWTGNVAKNPLITMGALNPKSTYESVGGLTNKLSIPLTSPNTPGPNPVGPPFTAPQTTNQFPFGGFARNGDILHVPFIGAYRIRRLQASGGGLVPSNPVDPGTLVDPVSGATNNVIELNAVTMDAAFAEDTDPTNNAHIPGGLVTAQEHVGRFTPNNTAYNWTGDLLNYLTTRSPALDYLPDTDPHGYKPGIPAVRGGAGVVTDMPQGVSNQAAGVTNANVTDNSTEDGVPEQGLININTAPAKVLAMLPLVPDPATGHIDELATEALARNIVTYRNTTGDFKSFFDLTKVTQFQTASNTLLASGDPYKNAGDYSGGRAPNTPDGIRYDFEEQYLLLNRISNLITTKSDSYTVYIVVQGWREAGTSTPALDWEKRAAYIMDRSSGQVRVTPVPTD